MASVAATASSKERVLCFTPIHMSSRQKGVFSPVLAKEPPLLSPKNSGNCLAKPNTSFRVSYVEIGLLHKCILGSYR